MRTKIVILIGIVIVIVVASAILLPKDKPAKKEANVETNSQTNFELNSPVFAENSEIPDKYTCKGENVSPPLEISGVPEDTKSLAIVMHDPDAPGGDFLHWTVWNISPDTKTIAENALPNGAVVGLTGFGKTGYGGPCPPSGTHHYVFDLYALRTTFNLSAGATRDQLEKELQAQTIAQTKLVGIVSAK